jgi:plasmid stabilization system protein ParE
VSLDISFAAFFAEDVSLQVTWYTKNAGDEIASKYATQVDRTVEFLADHPNLGKRCDFPEAEFTDLRFYPLSRPFHRHLVFYYVKAQTLIAFRVIDGARDLPKRLHDPPGVE